MQTAYLEMLSPGMIRISLTMVVVGTATFSIVGPIGTYITISAPDRVVLCTVAAVFSWPICYSLSVVTAYCARFRSPRQAGLAIALVLAVAALPCTAILYTVLALFYPHYHAPIGFLAIYLMTAIAVVVCHSFFHYVLCQRIKQASPEPARALSGEPEPGAADSDGTEPALQPPGQPADGPPTDTATPDTTPATTPPPVVPPATGTDAAPGDPESRTPRFDHPLGESAADVIFVKTEGRYVQVHTTTGSSRVIARFADVVAQFGDRGMQVHRSYWVSHHHARELVKRDTHTLVRLSNGRELPVSRTYLAAVRAVMGSRST